MDARALVEDSFERFEKVLSDLSTDGAKLARVTAEYRGVGGRFKVEARRNDPKVTQWVVEASCDADETVNDLLRAKLELENVMAVHRERLYMLKKKLEQGRTWSVDERTADQISAAWDGIGS